MVLLGPPLDNYKNINAMAESFFSSLKNERVYATKAQARRDVIAYIEGFYNSRLRPLRSNSCISA